MRGGGKEGGRGMVGGFRCVDIWLGFAGWVGLGCENLGTLVSFWSRERARSGSIVVMRRVVVGSMFVAGCLLTGCSCACVELLSDRRESARSGIMGAVR